MLALSSSRLLHKAASVRSSQTLTPFEQRTRVPFWGSGRASRCNCSAPEAELDGVMSDDAKKKMEVLMNRFQMADVDG